MCHTPDPDGWGKKESVIYEVCKTGSFTTILFVILIKG